MGVDPAVRAVPAGRSTLGDHRRRKAGVRARGLAISLAAHLLVGAALLLAWPVQRPIAEPRALSVAVVGLAAPGALLPEPSAVRAQERREAIRSAPRDRRPARAAPRTSVDRVPADTGSPPEQGGELSEAQLAGAVTADAGPARGGCDMARRLQTALRDDPLVRAAVLRSPGKAILVWSGDWVKSAGEEGKGLAAVREAMMWEIAFAPKACQATAEHGLVLLSVNPGLGDVRLAVGADRWRWSDLLVSPGGVGFGATAP